MSSLVKRSRLVSLAAAGPLVLFACSGAQQTLPHAAPEPETAASAGEAAARIEEAARGALPIARAGSMPEAVRIAREFARPRDCVLLSPACSSFDMFRDYKERGDVFAQAVRDLIGEKAADPARIASPAEAREVKP